MLIKLGQVWVDPGRVACIASAAGDVTVLIDGLEFTVASNTRHAEELKEEMAAIINGSLSGQSFGGEDGEEKQTS